MGSKMKIGEEKPIENRNDSYLLTDSMKRQSQHWFRLPSAMALVAKSVYINRDPEGRLSM